MSPRRSQPLTGAPASGTTCGFGRDAELLDHPDGHGGLRLRVEEMIRSAMPGRWMLKAALMNSASVTAVQPSHPGYVRAARRGRQLAGQAQYGRP